MPYIVVESNELPPTPFVPAPIPGDNGGTYFGSGFQNIRQVLPGPTMAMESYPISGTAGAQSESPYQTPAADGSSVVNQYKNGGAIVSPPHPVQVFSSREPNDSSLGGTPSSADEAFDVG